MRRFALPRPSRRTVAIVPPFAWLVLFLLVPFLLVFKISFAELQFGIPPYTPLAEFKDEAVQLSLHLRGYVLLFTDSLYVATYLNSVKMAAITTLCCILIGYPIAYYIARSAPALRNLLLLAVILPFWTSLLLRVYAWVGILRNDGLLNKLLMSLGLISSPLEIYRTDLAVYIGLVYAYLPFFILPLYANLVKMDLRLLEAAYDLGARPVAGVLAHHRAIVAAGRDRRRHAGVHPVGGRVRHPGNAGRRRHPDDGACHVERVLQQHRLADGLGRHLRDGAVAAGAAGPVPVQPDQAAGFRRRRPPMKGPNKSLRMLVLGLGYFFLYVPIISLMVFSFNDSPVVTSWTGFSLRWYGSLLEDSALLRAAWLSFKIAVLTATAATIIGTWAGYVLGRMGPLSRASRCTWACSARRWSFPRSCWASRSC